ncbi:MAG: hypothetical protein KA803_12050, partial [Rhodoferax sp.]|nr:hypothetical protein [Rhodoferax sp.]
CGCVKSAGDQHQWPAPLGPDATPPRYHNAPQNNTAPINTAGNASAASHDIFASLEKLAALQSRGIVTSLPP